MKATTARSTDSAYESFEADWQEWHSTHERHQAHPRSFLAVTHLQWLGPQPAALDGVAGTWSAINDLVTVVLEPGELLELEQQALPAGETVIGPVAERGGLNFTNSGDTVIELAKRGGEYIVRPRNPGNALLRAYQGTPAYSPDVAYALGGTYVPFETPRPTTEGVAVEGIQHVYEAPGEIRFKLAGQELALTAFKGHAPGSLSYERQDQQ